MPCDVAFKHENCCGVVSGAKRKRRVGASAVFPFPRHQCRCWRAFLLGVFLLLCCLLATTVAAAPLHEPAFSGSGDSFVGSEVAQQYTFGGVNLALVLSEDGQLHAYDLERGTRAWTVDLDGDMTSVEVELPPSRETLLRDPLALPFIVRGNSLFTRLPFFTYNPSFSSSLDTLELLENLPDYLRPYFFMNISTLLRRQTVFFGGTDVFVTTSVDVADVDGTTGRLVTRDHRGGAGRPTGASKDVKKGERVSVTHNQLMPTLHVVRYNIVIRVLKADEYSWSITLSQLQLSPRTQGSVTASSEKMRATPSVPLRAYGGEENPRFFSHLMRGLFDYDAEHIAEKLHHPPAAARDGATGDAGDSSAGAMPLSMPEPAALLAALQHRRTQAAQHVSGLLALRQYNASHLSLHNVWKGTTIWNARLSTPPITSAPKAKATHSPENNQQEEGALSRPKSRWANSNTAAPAVAAYLWMSGSDQVFRIPVQRLDNRSTRLAREDPAWRPHASPPILGSLVAPVQGSVGGLQLVPVWSKPQEELRFNHAALALDVEGDEREAAELDKYMQERSWWADTFLTGGAGGGGSPASSADNAFTGFSSPEEHPRTGLAWRTAGFLSFHVICLAGSIAFLCAGVPPRNHLQRAWVQADRNRDRLSHHSASRPQSAQLVPQDLLALDAAPSATPYVMMDGFSDDSPAFMETRYAASLTRSRSQPLSPLDVAVAARVASVGDVGTTLAQRLLLEPTPDELYDVLQEGEKYMETTMPAASTGRSATLNLDEGITSSTSTQPGRRSSVDHTVAAEVRTESSEAQQPNSLPSAVDARSTANGVHASNMDDDEDDDESEDIDLGERWWVRAQHRSRLPSTGTIDGSTSDQASSVCPSPVTNNTDETGELFQNQFKVLEKIGFGGEGSVFCVENRVTHGRYAIKAILIHEQDENRVVQEAVLHSSFDHANVVRFYFCWIEDIAVSTADRLQLCNSTTDGMDTTSLGFSRASQQHSSSAEDTCTTNDIDNATDVGSTYHMLFIQMEYFPRGTLADYLRTRTGFYRLEVLRYMLQIADGLAYLHNQDVVHRDLKPTNIFLSNSNSLKIGDFGLAKRRVTTAGSNGDLSSNVAGRQQERSVVGGSPLYCSPEQARGDVVGKPSDIFSLGIIAVEMLCTFATLHERIRFLTDAHQGLLPAELAAEFPEEVQIIRPLLNPEPRLRLPVRRLQRLLKRLIDALEDESEEDGEEAPRSPAEPSVLTAEVDSATHSDDVVSPQKEEKAGRMEKEEKEVEVAATGRRALSLTPSPPLRDAPVTGEAAEADTILTYHPASPLGASTSPADAVSAAGPLPAWTSSILFNSRRDSVTPLVTRGKNSYHDRRSPSWSSSPRADPSAMSNFSLTDTQTNSFTTAAAETIVSNPYGLPNLPVTYQGDNVLSTVLKRDLQDRTILPPD